VNHQREVRHLRERRKFRVRKRVRGTAERPRLCVTRSLKHVYVQLVDDEARRTLVSASTLETELRGQVRYGGNKTAAQAVGKLVAQRALAAGVSLVAFDRGSSKYHGRVAALAEAAREAGLKF